MALGTMSGELVLRVGGQETVLGSVLIDLDTVVDPPLAAQQVDPLGTE